jgi:hypothetical protein
VTVTSNIHFGLSVWVTSHIYGVGDRVSNAGNAYACTLPGTSNASGGPVTTGASITDGTVTWRFLSTIDFTTVQGWFNAIPVGITQPYVGLVWNDGTITTTTSTSFLVTTANTGSSVTNTITLTAAPGESFRDRAGGVPLGFNVANGASFTLPSGVGGVNYFDIATNYFVLDGLQIYDPNTTSGSTLIGAESTATNLTIINCLLSGTAQTGGATIVNGAVNTTIVNTIIVDRQAVGDNFGAFQGGNVNFVNSALFAINTPTGGIGLNAPGTVKNSAIFGYPNNPVAWSSGSVSVDHSVFDAAVPNSTMAIGTGVLFGKVAVNQWITPGTDFRLKAGSDFLNAGVTDTVDVPRNDDIARSVRPLGTSWDVGPFERVPVSAPTLLSINGAGSAVLSRSAVGTASPLVLGGAGIAGQSDLANGTATGLRVTGSGALVQTLVASGSVTGLRITGGGFINQAGVLSGNVTALTVNASGIAGQRNGLTGFAVPLVFSASGSLQVPVGASGSALALGFNATGMLRSASAIGQATALRFTANGIGQILNFASGAAVALALSATGSATVTSNLPIVSFVHFNLAVWQPNTLYGTGDRVSNGGNAYVCVASGRSQNFVGAGPNGAGAAINDGTATWRFLSTIDYTVLQDWANALPTILTRPVIAYVAGTFAPASPTAPHLVLQGHTTTTVNSITIAAMPGQGFRDRAGSLPLAFNSAAGSALVMRNPATPWNWIEIADSNVTLSGLQLNASPTDGCTLLQVDSGAANVTLSASIFDGAAQSGGANMIVCNGDGVRVLNCLIIDREPASSGNYALDIEQGGLVMNTTMVAPNAPSAVALVSRSPTLGAVTVRNSIIAGFTQGLYAEGIAGGVLAVSNTFTGSVYGPNVNNGGGNLLATNPIFIDPALDFRLQPNSPCVNAGANDPLDLPSSDDVFYSTRPLGGGWDIGAFEVVQQLPINALNFNAMGRASPGVSAIGMATALVLSAVGSMSVPVPGTGRATALVVSGSGTASQFNAASGVGTALTFSLNGFAATPQPVSGAANWLTVTGFGNAGQEARLAGFGTPLSITAAGLGNNPLPAAGSALGLVYTATGTARFDLIANGAVPVLNFGAIGIAAPSRSATGAATALGFSASGRIAFANAFIGSGVAYQITSVGTALQENLTRGVADALQIIAGGTIGSAAPAIGSATALRLGGAGTAVNPPPLNGSATALNFSTNGAASQSNLLFGVTSVLGFSANGALGQTQFASGNTTAFGFSASGAVGVLAVVSGNATALGFSANGTSGQVVRAFGVATPFVVGAVGAARVEFTASGKLLALNFTGTGTLGQEVLASGSATIFAPSASGVISAYAATGRTNWLTLTCSGLVGTEIPATGVASPLVFTASGTISSATTAQGRATAFTVTANGSAYQIPNGSQIDEIIYFPRDDRLIYFRN